MKSENLTLRAKDQMHLRDLNLFKDNCNCIENIQLIITAPPSGQHVSHHVSEQEMGFVSHMSVLVSLGFTVFALRLRRASG